MKKAALNTIRKVTKSPLVEQLLILFTTGKRRNSFWAKLAPRREQYKPSEFRDASNEGINYRLYLNDYDDYMLYFKIQAEKREYFELVKDGMVVLDIGTNIGMSLLNFAKRNHSGMNYGFEPVPQTYARAKFNVEANPFKNVKLNNIALSDKEEELAFQIPVDAVATNSTHSGGAFLSKVNASNGNVLLVKATTLDSFCETNGIAKIDFIKMDVEGFEVNAIKGGINILKRLKPLLYVEINDEALKRQGQTPQELLELLRSIGYKVQSFPNANLLMNMKDFTNCYFDVLCSAG